MPQKVPSLLIEASKLIDEYNDGIKRFVVTLIKSLAQTENYGGLSIKVLISNEVLELSEVYDKFIANSENSSIKSRLDEYSESKPSRSFFLTKIKSRVGLWLYRNKLFAIKDKLSETVRVLLGNGPEQYDLIHYTLPQLIINWNYSKRHLVTVHDVTHLTHPEFHQEDNIINASRGFEIIKSKKPYIHTVSNQARLQIDLANYLVREQSKTIYEAIDSELFYLENDSDLIKEVKRKYSLDKKKYVFSLATYEPRKNLANTARAFLKMRENINENISLVIAGKPGWKSENLPEDEGIFNLGYVPDDDLRILYNCASIFAFLSHNEGFGLPPIEAMACGTVAVYGDNSSMNEIIGPYGLAADPNDLDSISSAMEKLLVDNELRLSMEKSAIEYAKSFSLSQFGESIIGYYQEIIKNSTL